MANRLVPVLPELLLSHRFFGAVLERVLQKNFPNVHDPYGILFIDIQKYAAVLFDDN
jgi:hypothetical protein